MESMISFILIFLEDVVILSQKWIIILSLDKFVGENDAIFG